VLEPPDGEDPREYVVFNRFGTAVPDAGGRFELGSAPDAPMVTYAASESGAAFVALSFGEPGTQRIDAISTARALVALNPLLMPDNPDEHREIWSLIEDSEVVDELGALIAQAHAGGREAADDPAVIEGLDAAVSAILSEVGSRQTGIAAGVIAPGQCIDRATLALCNHDMLNLTLAGSSGAALRIAQASGPLGIRTNVDWVARVVGLDAARVPSAGGRYLFDPDTIDEFILPGGLDRRVVVRGELAAGWLRYVFDPVEAFSHDLGSALLRPGDGGIPLDPGLYATVAVSGSWAGDVEEYVAVLDSPWQRQMALTAVGVNLASLVADALAIVAPLSGSEILDLLEQQRATFEIAQATILEQPELAEQTIVDLVGSFLATGIARLAEVNSVAVVRSGRIRKLVQLSWKSAGTVLRAWTTPIRITTRVGGLARNVSPRESGYAVYRPADTLLEQLEIPADGMVVETAHVLEEGIVYRLVISGLYRYDEGERGEFADAQYRENDRDEYAIRYDSVEFDGQRLEAVAAESDRIAHTFTFYVAGRGAPLALNIRDDNYRDNEGSLTAALYGPGPLTRHAPGSAEPDTVSMSTSGSLRGAFPRGIALLRTPLSVGRRS
jgi:hypothetical protein